MSKPSIDELSAAMRVLGEWQRDELPIQLHPGDIGWFWRFGAEATAAAVRIWSRDDTILAVGLKDGPELLRLAIAPAADHDDELARQLHADISKTERGVLPAGTITVEARFGAAFRDLLFSAGWTEDEPWTPLHRDLTEPVPASDLRIEIVRPEQATARTAVQR